jgi:CelD/BcsL family acetyltransferase involved in cellulose biosynthesis
MVAVPHVGPELALSAGVIRTNAELRSIEEEWKEVFRRTRCDNTFLSFEWMSEWWNHLGQDHQLFVVTVRDEKGHLAALAPLYISSGPLRIRRLGFLGDRLVGSDYLDIIVDDTFMPTAIVCVCRLILEHRREWDYLELSDIRADSIAATVFRTTLESCGMTPRALFSSMCPYVRLPETPEVFAANLDPVLRQNMKRRSRALSREGSVEFCTIRDAREIESAFDDLLRLHQARFGVRGCESAFLDPRVRAFHRGTLKSLSQAGCVRIRLLKLQGRTIAVLYGFSIRQKLLSYQCGIDPSYSRFGVGKLLISFALEDEIRNHGSEFDFLRGNEPYKTDWATGTRQLYTLLFFDEHGKSKIAHTTLLFQESMRRCKAALSSTRPMVQVRSIMRHLSATRPSRRES